MGRLTAAFLVTLLGGGCVTTTHDAASPYASVRDVIPAHAALEHGPSYAPLEEEPLFEMVPARKDSDYTVFDVFIPSAGRNRQRDGMVTGEYFQSNAPGSRPLVVVLPIWGASTYPPRTLQRRLTRGPIHGLVNVLILDGAANLFDWEGLASVASEEAFDRLIRDGIETTWTTVADVRRLLDWAERRPETNGRMAIVGFSRGAMMGSLLMGIEPRLDTGVFLMGGADIHDVIATCPGQLGRVRKHVHEQFGWTADQYAQRLEEPLASINPARWAGSVRPNDVLYVEATRDKCVPESARQLLWSALGEPERIRIHAGHRRAFLSMTLLDFHSVTRRIKGFLEERLLQGNPDAPAAVASSGSAR